MNLDYGTEFNPATANNAEIEAYTANQKRIDDEMATLEAVLNSAMISCAIGDKVWCKSNFECSGNKVCYQK